MNPLYLKYGFLAKNRDAVFNADLNESIRAVLPPRCKLNNKYSSLFIHSLRCNNIAEIYGFPSYLCKALLFHNIYGTASLGSIHFNEYLDRSDYNRASIYALLGAETELLIYQYSFLDQNILIKSPLGVFPPGVQIMYFINTLEIISGIQNATAPFFKKKIQMHLPALKIICSRVEIHSFIRNQMLLDFSFIESCVKDTTIEVK